MYQEPQKTVFLYLDLVRKVCPTPRTCPTLVWYSIRSRSTRSSARVGNAQSNGFARRPHCSPLDVPTAPLAALHAAPTLYPPTTSRTTQIMTYMEHDKRHEAAIGIMELTWSTVAVSKEQSARPMPSPMRCACCSTLQHMLKHAQEPPSAALRSARSKKL